MRLNFADGSYNLSYFNIVIGTNEELSQNVIEKNKSTFVHEYIHFLQDLILPFNIRYNLSNVRHFFCILEFAHRYGKVTRPFNNWTNESRTLMTQFERSFGGFTENKHDGFINFVSEIGNPNSDFVMTSGFDSNLQIRREHRVYRYNLPVYEKGKSIPIDYNLGARDLLEYIAYKIEVKKIKNRALAPQLPYESIDLIFDKYGLSYISEDIRLCIAEFCLHNDTPIHFLLHILLDNVDFKTFISNNSYEDIYKYLLSLGTVTRDGHIESLSGKTQRRLKEFASELKIQYKGFSEIESWILKISDYVERELSERFVFSDMYKMETNEFNEFISSVIDYIGVPLVLNSKENYISIMSNKTEEMQFIQFYILQKFIGFVKSKNERLCPVYDFCSANGGICNENCILNSELLIKGNKNCYYTEFLKTYGLLNVKFD